MIALKESAKKIFEDYHRFDDGLILSFEYFYAPNEPLAAQIVLYARNHKLEDSIWRKIKVVVRDVQELVARVKGNQFNSISSGVRLLNFGDLWCVEIDGDYSLAGDPASLDEVRKDGQCYVIGRQVEVCELDDES
nr:hypothetical protein [Massilia sp. JS1662]